MQIQNIYDEGTVLHRYICMFVYGVFYMYICIFILHSCICNYICPVQVYIYNFNYDGQPPRGSVEDTAAYATSNATGYAESVLGAGIGSNGKVE